MIYLLLSVFCSTLLMLGFKLFEKYKVDTFHAIVVNYITCVVIGLPLVSNYNLSAIDGKGWIPLGLVLGSMFIALFFLIGVTTQKLGVSVATVSMKLGYVLPIVLAFTVYNESITNLKILGIVLTVLAVVLTSIKSKKVISDDEQLSPSSYFLFPLIIFVGSGLADSIVQFTEKTYFKQGGFEMFNILLFVTAAAIGLVFALRSDIKSKSTKFTKKNILAGVLLGIPNYGSIYFLFKALGMPNWESSMVFPINNIGIVVASTLLAITFFKERLSALNIVGLILALISILVMAPVLIQTFQNWLF